MKLTLLFLLGFIYVISFNINAQITDIELGKSSYYRSGLYDLSEPGAVNIKVAVWGYVAKPGKYVVPDYTTASDLLSYAGGPDQNAVMDDLRIYRILDNGKEEMIKFSYNDILWENNLSNKNRIVPELKPSDILIVPGSPKLFFRDWFNIGMQIFSVELTIVNLIILINIYN